MTLIHERVALAREGKNPYVIARLKSGWAVAGDVQPLPGYCLLLPDPVVSDLNSLAEGARADYCLDMIRIGDALLKVTDAYRVNYETQGNSDEALHTHIRARYRSEDEAKRRRPVCMGYEPKAARRFDPVADGAFLAAMRAELER